MKYLKKSFANLPYNFTKNVVFINLLLSTILLQGCVHVYNADVKRGNSYQYHTGYPEVRFSAEGYLDEQDRAFIHIAADMVYGSVLFKRFGDQRKANLAIELQVLNHQGGDSVVISRRFSFNQIIAAELTTSQKLFTFNRDLSVAPGNYKIKFTLVDQTTHKHTTRNAQVTIPDPAKHQSSLANIRLMGKNTGKRNNKWFSVTTYDIPSKIDSLKFTFRVNNKSDTLFTIQSRLLKFESYTSAALPMSAHNYNPSDIAYKGIDYHQSTVVKASSRKLIQQGGVTIEFKYATLPRGNYRLEVSSSSGVETDLYKARDFGVKSTNYPTLKTPRELALPLVYLMKSRAYNKLLAIKNADSLKQAVDRFWLKTYGNERDAKSILQLYYQRAEEANKRFANFKEGWKTDRGMIFILFGTPISTGQVRDKLRWSYSYDRNDPNYNYVFEEARPKSQFYPFDYYRLQRRLSYHQREYYQRQLWLTGAILTRKL